MSPFGLKFSQMILYTETSKLMHNLSFLFVVLHKPTLLPSTFNSVRVQVVKSESESELSPLSPSPSPSHHLKVQVRVRVITSESESASASPNFFSSPSHESSSPQIKHLFIFQNMKTNNKNVSNV